MRSARLPRHLAVAPSIGRRVLLEHGDIVAFAHGKRSDLIVAFRALLHSRIEVAKYVGYKA